MKGAWIVILALAAAGCASSGPPAPRNRTLTAAGECRQIAAREPVAPAAAAPRVGTPWWWSSPAGADPSRLAVKSGLRDMSPCPLEQ